MNQIIEHLIETCKISLSEKSKEELSSILKKTKYKKNEIVLDAGEFSTDFYIVKEGIIRQFYYKDGRDVSEHFSCQYDIVYCIESVFLNKPTSLIVEAIEDTVVYKVNYKQLLDLCNRYTDIGNLYRRILELDLILTQRKADSWRFETSRQRYERFCIEYPEVVKRASVSHIASYLLMTPETLSRIRANKL